MARSLRINSRKSHRNNQPEVIGIADTDNTAIGEGAGSEPIADVTGNEPEPIVTDTWKSNDDAGIVDPATLAPGGSSTGTDSGTDTGRRRGRPAGSKNGTKTGRRNSGKTEATSNIEKTLFTIHMMGAAFLGVPELLISSEESKSLADAVTTVTELYEVPFLDDKTQAWIGLAVVAGSIYVPRVIAVLNTSKRKGAGKTIHAVA